MAFGGSDRMRFYDDDDDWDGTVHTDIGAGRYSIGRTRMILMFFFLLLFYVGKELCRGIIIIGFL